MLIRYLLLITDSSQSLILYSLQPLVYYRLNSVVLVYTPPPITPLCCIYVRVYCIKTRGSYNPLCGLDESLYEIRLRRIDSVVYWDKKLRTEYLLHYFRLLCGFFVVKNTPPKPRVSPNVPKDCLLLTYTAKVSKKDCYC